MKNAIVKKIISSLSYEDIIEDCPIKNDSGDVRIAKRIFDFTKYGILSFLAIGMANNFLCLYDLIFSNYSSTLSIALFYASNILFVPMLIATAVFYFKFKKVLKNSDMDDEFKILFIKNFNYTENSSFLSFLKLTKYLSETILIVDISEHKLSLNLYKKLAEKLSKEEMLQIVNEKLTYSDLKISSVYIGENKNMKNLFNDEFNFEKGKYLELEHVKQKTAAEEFVDSLYIENK